MTTPKLLAVCLAFTVPAAPAPAQPMSLPQMTHARRLHTAIDLRNGGVIVVPAGPEYRELGTRIQAKLREIAHANYALAANAEAMAPGQVVIALGNMMNNPVLESLYWNFFTLVNPTYPGEQGFVIETVYEPLPLWPHNNVVVLGASTLPTSAEAVTAFLAPFRTADDCVLGPTLNLEHIAQPTPKFRPNPNAKGLRSFHYLATAFHQSGDRRFLDEALRVLDAHCAMALANPDYALAWGDEIDSFREIDAWDFLQEFAHVSDADMLKYERFWLNHINKLIPRTEIFGHVQPGPRLAWNHTSIPMVGLYTVARYFQAHYGFPEMDRVLTQVRDYFDGQKDHYRVSEDAFFYSVFSLRPVMAYYSMSGQWQYVDSGNARKMVDLILAQVDNHGYSSGDGDSHMDPFPGQDYALEVLDSRLKLPDVLWFRKQLHAKGDPCTSKFYPDLQPQRPEFLNGCVSIPLDRTMYDALNNGTRFRMLDEAGTPPMPAGVPFDQAFDKLQFRSFEPNGGEYLLVDGFGRGNHAHQDTGEITLAQFDGCRFLFDADYLVAKSDDHSMVTVVKDAKAERPVPPLAALHHRVNFDGGAYACVEIPHYNGATWNRHVFWLKEKYFAVIDLLQAESPGTFKFDCVWKTFGRGQEQFNGDHELICRGPTLAVDGVAGPTKVFHLRSADPAWHNQRVSSEEVSNWRLHEQKTRTLQAGDRLSYQNVMYIERPAADGHVAQYTPVRISANALLVKSDHDAVLVAGPAKFGETSITADFAYIGHDDALFVNATRVTGSGGMYLDSTRPATFSIKSNLLQVDSPAAGRVAIVGGATIEFPAGESTHELPSGFTGTLEADLLAEASANSETKLAAAAEAPLPTLPAAWTALGNQPATVERDITAGDINGDGKAEIVVATGSTVVCYTAAGQPLWTHHQPAQVLSCAVADLGMNNPIHVLAGTAAGELIGLDANGKLVKSVTVVSRAAGEYGERGKHAVTQIRAHDLDHDARPEIILGLRSWQVHVFTADFQPRWYNPMILHGVTTIEFGTVPGKPDLFYAGDHYGGAYVFNIATDRPETRYRKCFTNIGDTSVAVCDLNDDGIDDLICASDGGRMSAFNGARTVSSRTNFYEEPEWAPLWTFNTYGYGYNQIELERGARPILITASDSGYLSFLDAKTGAFLHATHLGGAVKVFAVLTNGRIVAGTPGGSIFVLDAKGTPAATAGVGGPVLKIQPLGGGAFVVLTTTGQVSFFR